MARDRFGMEESLPIDGLDLDASEREAAETLLRWRLLADLDVMTGTLAELHFGVVSELYGGMPVDGSRMAADIAVHGAAVVAEVGRICGTWQVVGSDQLRAVVAAHDAGLMAFGTGPLLRSVLEHAVRVGWVLDGATGRDKGARAWLALVVGNGEDASTHRNKNSPVPTLAGAPERLRELCEVRIPAAFGEGPSMKGQTKDWSLCGQKWGDVTGRTEEFFDAHPRRNLGAQLNGRVQYRIASMFAHPSATGVFAHADQSTPGVLEFRWDWETTRIRTGVALIAHYSAMKSLYDYFGWSPPGLATWAASWVQFTRDTKPTPKDSAGG